jgi:hypothetical protein
VRMFDQGMSIRAVAEETIFSRQDATFINWMWRWGYLRLNGARELVVHRDVSKAGQRHALRVFDERSWSWIKPPKPDEGGPAEGALTPGHRRATPRKPA